MNIEEFKKDVTNKKIKDLWYFYKRSNDNKNALVRDMNSLTLFIKDKFNLDIYLVYGTLLGAIRENDFMAHDNDVDFAYLSKTDNAKDALHEFYGISAILKNHNMLGKVCCNGQLHVYSPNRRNKFDLWSSYISEDKFYLIPLFDGDMDSSIITPLKQIKFRSCDLLIPNKSELFLDNTYKNWKLPILDNKGLIKSWKKIL